MRIRQEVQEMLPAKVNYPGLKAEVLREK